MPVADFSLDNVRARLLNGMRQFMGNKHTTARALRRVLPLPEHDIPSYGVRSRIDRPRRVCRLLIGMHTNAAKVSAKAAFKEGPSPPVERSTAAETVDKIIGRMAHCIRMIVMIGFALRD